MLWGKLFPAARFERLDVVLMWPVVLAAIMPGVGYWSNLPTIGGFFLIVALTCVTTAMTALFCSTLFRKSATALMAAYLISASLFLLPPAASWFCTIFLPNSPLAGLANASQVFSPFAAAFHLPLDIGDYSNSTGSTSIFSGDTSRRASSTI